MWARHTRELVDPEIIKVIIEHAQSVLSYESPLVTLAQEKDCCLEHSCPHHDGLKQDVNGKWYNPLEKEN